MKKNHKKIQTNPTKQQDEPTPLLHFKTLSSPCPSTAAVQRGDFKPTRAKLSISYGRQIPSFSHLSWEHLKLNVAVRSWPQTTCLGMPE